MGLFSTLLLCLLSINLGTNIGINLPTFSSTNGNSLELKLENENENPTWILLFSVAPQLELEVKW